MADGNLRNIEACPRCGLPELTVGVVMAADSNCRYEVTGLDGTDHATVRVHPDGILQVEEVVINCSNCDYQDWRFPTFDRSELP